MIFKVHNVSQWQNLNYNEITHFAFQLTIGRILVLTENKN